MRSLGIKKICRPSDLLTFFLSYLLKDPCLSPASHRAHSGEAGGVVSLILLALSSFLFPTFGSIFFYHRVNRCSPQKIYNPSESARQARVMFNSDASSTASDVGRENASIT